MVEIKIKFKTKTADFEITADSDGVYMRSVRGACEGHLIVTTLEELENLVTTLKVAKAIEEGIEYEIGDISGS